MNLLHIVHAYLINIKIWFPQKQILTQKYLFFICFYKLAYFYLNDYNILMIFIILRFPEHLYINGF